MTTTEYDKIDKFAAEGTHEHVLRTRADYSHGTRGDMPMFYRFVVLETIFDPTIIDDNKASYFAHELGVSNVQFVKQLPRNAIIGQRVLDGRASAEPPMFLFPFFPPNLSLPCQPGEHVWVMFENPSGKKMDLGFWMCRIVGPGFVEDVNHTHAPRAHDPSFNPGTKAIFDGDTTAVHDFRNGHADTDSSTGDRYTIAETATLSGDDEKAYEKLITASDGGKLSPMEAVPRFRKRPADIAIEGSNNTLIVLGRDRSSSVAKYTSDPAQGKVVQTYPDADIASTVPGAGSIDIVAGRGQTAATGGTAVTNSLNAQELKKTTADLAAAEGDMDPITDRSRVLVSQKMPVDKRFGLDSYNSDLGLSDSSPGDGAIVVKSDKVRIIARSDVQLIVSGFSVVDGKMVDATDSSKFATLAIDKDGRVTLKTGADVGIIVPDATIAVKSGEIDIAAKSKVSVTSDTEVDVFAPAVKCGDSAAAPLVLALPYQQLLTALTTFATAMAALSAPPLTPVGAAGTTLQAGLQSLPSPATTKLSGT